MPWYVSRILGLGDIHPYMLPYGQFVLVDEKKNKREVAGWLPCHHANVEYELCLKNNGDIVSISSMRICCPVSGSNIAGVAGPCAAPWPIFET